MHASNVPGKTRVEKIDEYVHTPHHTQIYPSRVKMSSNNKGEVNLRDFGTQLSQNHLAPHLRQHEVKCKRSDAISEERRYSRVAPRGKARTRNWSVQTGKFGPIGKGGILKHVSIKYPSEACLKKLEDLRQRPTISAYENVTSKLKRSFCAELLTIAKQQAKKYDLLYKKIDGVVYARIYGPGFEPYE